MSAVIAMVLWRSISDTTFISTPAVVPVAKWIDGQLASRPGISNRDWERRLGDLVFSLADPSSGQLMDKPPDFTINGVEHIVGLMNSGKTALQESGPAGIADGRSQRAADPLGGVDERWLAMCRLVLAEHTEASRPTKELLLRRVSARLAAEHGEGTVPEPGRRRARAVLAELTRGTNAFAGSTKGKRSIAARPQGVYGRLRPARPGELLLLDTTPLDVFAMEPVTLRWVRCELTIAMDLYSRAITGLRLSPVSTKSVDAALVLFEALRPGSRQHTSGGLLPYAGLPDLVVTGDGTAGLAAVAAETIVIDHGKTGPSGKGQ